MYAAVRRYEGITDDAEAGRLVGESFIPLLEHVSGFIAYYWIDAGDGVMASLSVFDDKAGADESVTLAHQWVQENAAALIPNPPQVTEGLVVASDTSSAPGLESLIEPDPRAPRGSSGAVSSPNSVDPMTQGLRTFLTFQAGAATAALDLYRDVFDDFELIEIDHYGPADNGPADTVKVAKFRVAGSDFSCADSPVRHEWGFTPAVSLWIDCNDNNELQRLFDRLSEGGRVFMPLDDYGFSTRFGWVGDRYGVTWQLNLP